MLYIISFQSISCREASPPSPRPHKGPPEGSSIGHPLNLPPGFPHVAQLCPLAGPSKQFSSRPERRSSPRPPYPQVPQSHPGVAKPSSIIPSPRPPYPQVPQSHPAVPNNPTISLKQSSNRTSTGPRHGHPAHRYSSAIPTCRDVPKPVSERCSERFLRRSSDRLPVRAGLSGGRGEKEVGKCLEFRNLRLLQGALDGEGTVQNIDRFH